MRKGYCFLFCLLIFHSDMLVVYHSKGLSEHIPKSIPSVDKLYKLLVAFLKYRNHFQFSYNIFKIIVALDTNACVEG